MGSAVKQYLDDEGNPVGAGSDIKPPKGYSLLSSKKSPAAPKKTVKDLKLEAAKRTPVVPPHGYLLTKSPLLDQFYAKETKRVADTPLDTGASAFDAPAARLAPLVKPIYNPANQAAGAQSTLASVPNAPKPKTIGEEVQAQRAGSHITYVAPNIGQPAAHPDASYVQAQPLISPEVTGALKEVATHPLEVLTGASLPSQQQENMQRVQRVASETNDPFLKAAPAVEQRQHDPNINISGTKTFQRVLDPKSKNVFSRVMTGGTKGVEALSSVDNLGLMAGMYFSPADAGQLISAVFSAQMAQGAGSQGIETLKAAYKGDYGEAAERGANALVSAAFAAMAGKHALGIEKAPSFAESARQGLTEGAGDVMGGKPLTDHPFTPITITPIRDRTNVLHRNTAGEVRQAKGQAPTVWLSPTAWKSLMGAMYPRDDAAATHGFNHPADDRLLAIANNPQLAATNPVFAKVQRLLAEAHKNAGEGGVAIANKREYVPDTNRIDPATGTTANDPSTGKPFNRAMQANINVMREELNHTWQRSLAASGKFSEHLSTDAFSRLNPIIPAGMHFYLLGQGYDVTDIPTLVTEASAKLMGSNPDYFGVTPEEAASFMRSYLDEVVAQHGPEALNSLKRIRGVAKQVKETVDAEHKARGTNDGMGDGAADRGVLQSMAGGGTGGTSETHSGTGSKNGGQVDGGTDDRMGNGSTNRGVLQGVPAGGRRAPESIQGTSGQGAEGLFNREKDKPIWYLKSERLIGDKMRGPMPAGDVQKMLLAGGVKPEEMHWTGLDDFLKSKGKEKVTPEEIREHLALDRWKRTGEAAAKAGSASYWHERGNDELFNREQTKTPEFKAWFGDSKVVDKDGEPKVLYHGTTHRNPKVLRQSFEAGNGIFLTDNDDVAYTFTQPREYGEPIFEDEDGNEIKAGDVVLIYARIENPLVISGQDAQKVSDDTALQARTLKQAKADGHDGVILRDIKEGIGERYRGDTYVVFDPKQVKSAEKNSGAFDPHDPNILRNREKPKEDTPVPTETGYRSMVDTGTVGIVDLTHEDYKILNKITGDKVSSNGKSISSKRAQTIVGNLISEARKTSDAFEKDRLLAIADHIQKAANDNGEAGVPILTVDTNRSPEEQRELEKHEAMVHAGQRAIGEGDPYALFPKSLTDDLAQKMIARKAWYALRHYGNDRAELAAESEAFGLSGKFNRLGLFTEDEIDELMWEHLQAHTAHHGEKLNTLDLTGKRYVDALREAAKRHDDAKRGEELPQFEFPKLGEGSGQEKEVPSPSGTPEGGGTEGDKGDSGAGSEGVGAGGEGESESGSLEDRIAPSSENKITAEMMKSLTPEQMERGKKMLEEWERKNYHEPYVGTATEHNVHSKTTKTERYHKTYRKQRAEEEQRIARTLLDEKNTSAEGQEPSPEQPKVTVHPVTVQGGTTILSMPVHEPTAKVHTSVPSLTTTQVSVPLKTALEVTPVVTRRVLSRKEIMAMAAGLNPQRKVSNIKDLIEEANKRNPNRIVP